MTEVSRDECDDRRLVERSLEGERDAFGCLYDRYARLVRAIAYDAASDYATAQDLTQETFLRAFQNLANLRDRERFGSWLAGIARLVCKENRKRIEQNARRFVQAELSAVASGSDDSRLIVMSEESAALLREVAQLPERERLAIHAFYLEGSSAEQAAAIVGVSRAGLYKLLGRACQRLAQRLRSIAPEKEGR